MKLTAIDYFTTFAAATIRIDRVFETMRTTILILAAAQALQPLAPHVKPQPRYATSGASEDPLQAFARSVDAIWSLPGSGPPATRSRMTKERKEATHATLWGKREWEQQCSYEHGPLRRYARVMARSFWSPLMRGLAPTIGVLAAWSVFVFKKKLTITANGLGFLASPIGLLLAFRVNSCVSRFHTAREMWGQIIFTSRDLAATLSATAEIESQTKARCGRLLAAYGWCVKAACNFEEPPAEVLKTLLSEEDANAVLSARKPALASLALLRKATINLPLAIHVEHSVHHSITDLNRLFGGIERLISTPLAPMFMRHYQRGLLAWLILLPCGLYKAGCSTAPKLAVVVASVAYLMLGIDEIGLQIEQPFVVMPVHTLAEGLTRDVLAELS